MSLLVTKNSGYTGLVSREMGRRNPKSKRNTVPVSMRFFCARALNKGREGGSYKRPLGGKLPAWLAPGFEPPGRLAGLRVEMHPARRFQRLSKERFMAQSNRAALPAHAAMCGTTPHFEQNDERDLRIVIWRDCAVIYYGTAAQLQAEGLIPKDIEWPHAAGATHWTINTFEFTLRRARPEGHKGPMKSWLGLDSWLVRVEPRGCNFYYFSRRSIARKAEDLAREIHRQTAAGQREWLLHCNRLMAAKEDIGFQAFKSSLLPKRNQLRRATDGKKNSDRGVA